MQRNTNEIQPYDAIAPNVPIGLSIEVREEIVRHLNQTLADTITLRDLDKKCHWQVAGPTFYQLRLLFDKHHGEQSELVDEVAERVHTLAGSALRWLITSLKGQ